jgi:mRNA deadenylase 3'-5' endonuclease subunit Ccr4
MIQESPQVRIMSYNILADHYAQEHARELYASVPWAALEWSSRAAMIAKEVAHWNPDVVSFQEVDHYRHLQALLKPHGYKGVYTQRTGGRPDGLAMFWRRNRFTAEALKDLEFAPMDLKDNVCQLTVLRSKEESSVALVVANIHVLFNPKRGDIKLAQVRTMLESVHSLAAARPAGPCPVVVCGDFNSAAGSPIYEFVLKGELELGSIDRRRLSGQVEAAGRTGWPSIRGNFLNALNRGAASEADAMQAALGYQIGGRDDEERSGGGGTIDVNTTMLPHSASAPAELDGRPNNNGNANILTGSAKKFRPWAQEELEMAAGSENGVARHPLHLESAYLSVSGTEPLYTTAHDRYVGTVDYIFYSPQAPSGAEEEDAGNSHSRSPEEESLTLKPLRVFKPPPLRTMHSGLPSLMWPSDHLSLIVDFAIHREQQRQ